MQGAVVSACYGGWDTVKPPAKQEGAEIVDWCMVTDDPALDCPGWRKVVEPRPHMHPCLAAKVPKFRTDLYVPAEADYSIWVDASATVGAGFAAMCEASIHEIDMAMFPHPHRTSLADEVTVSRTIAKYDALPLEAQVRHYIERGNYPDPWWLWASGCIVRRDPQLARHKYLGDAWLLECVRWGFQDQLSLAYLLWREDWTVGWIGTSLFTSEHVTFGPHNA